MIILVLLGFICLKQRMKHILLFSSFKLSLKINLIPRLRLSNLIRKVSFDLSPYCFLIWALSIIYLVHTYHNRMGGLSEKIIMWLKWDHPFLLSQVCPYLTSLMPFKLPLTLLIVSLPLCCTINPVTSHFIINSQLIFILRFLVPHVFHICALIIPIKSNIGHWSVLFLVTTHTTKVICVLTFIPIGCIFSPCDF